MSRPLHVLFIEDSEDDYIILSHHLEKSGFDVRKKRVYDLDELKKSLREESWDVVIADYMIPGLDAIDVFKAVKDTGLNLPFIVVSGQIQDDKAAEVMHDGAHDFVTKANLSRLIPAIHREMSGARERDEHDKLRRELVQSRTDYRTLTESISDYFFALDDQFQISFWNPACEEKTGLRSEQVLGKSLYEILSDIKGSSFDQIMHKALESKSVQRCRDTYREIFFEMTVYPATNGIAILARDDTDKYKAEHLRRKQEEMQRQMELNKRLRHLGQLASGVAHEVRNPLNAIMSLATALFDELEGNEDLLLYKKHMLSQVDRLSKLMEDLLAMGKPISMEDFSRLNLREIIESSAEFWNQTKSSHTLTLSFAPEKQFMIHGVSSKLEQVITNILDNAAQHSPEKSEIQIHLDSDSNQHVCTIVDRGSGLSEEAIEHLFEPFYTSRRNGTGLGLGIVKNIVESHGGTIDLRNNTDGPGCIVEIRLPHHIESAL
ncbi:MAG: ATP-binding protein [Fibrobacterota bacterium]